MTTDDRLQALCEWAAATELGDIPGDVRQRAMLVMADDLACAIAGAGDAEASAWAARGLDGAAPPAGTATASVFGQDRALPAPLAAASNATHANWWQLDGGHYEFMCHAGLYCMPTALAEGQARGSTLGEVLRAFVIGYETTCRLAAAAPRGEDLHPHAQWSAVAAFATLGALRRLGPRALATGLRALAADAPLVPFGAMLRGELQVNLLAGAGILRAFAAAAAVPEDRPEIARTIPPAATDWALRKSYHKLVACAGQAMPALEALLAARAAASEPAGTDVVRITAHLHAYAATMMERQPATSLGARFSIPHVLAVAWVHGRTDPSALGGEFLHDAAVARARAVVAFAPYAPVLAPPYHRAARVEVDTARGRSSGECLAPHGSPAHPLSVDDVRAKIETLCGDRLQRWLAATGRLDQPGTLSAPLATVL